MTKCYYCGSAGRGCPECAHGSRAGGKTEAPPLERVLGKPIWKPVDMNEASEQLAKTPRTPISADTFDLFEDSSWEKAVAWCETAQRHVREIDAGIRLELVREPSHPGFILYCRWEIPDHPDMMKRQRMQNWQALILGTPYQAAKRVTEYIARARVRARKEFEVPACTTIRGACPTHGEYTAKDAAGCPECLPYALGSGVTTLRVAPVAQEFKIRGFSAPQHEFKEPLNIPAGESVTVSYDKDSAKWKVEKLDDFSVSGDLEATFKIDAEKQKAWTTGEWELSDNFETFVSPEYAPKPFSIEEMQASVDRIRQQFPVQYDSDARKQFNCRSITTPVASGSWRSLPAFDALELMRPDPIAELAERISHSFAKMRHDLFLSCLKSAYSLTDEEE